jgi:hypothetical protein
MLGASVFLPWATVGFDAPGLDLADRTVRGIDIAAGWAVLAGAVLTGAGLVFRNRWIALFGGTTGLGAALWLLIDGGPALSAGVEQAAAAVSSTTGIPAEGLVTRIFDVGGDAITASPDLGIWLAVFGGIAVVAGALLTRSTD